MGSVRASWEPVLDWDGLSAPEGACQRAGLPLYLRVTQCLAECWPRTVLRTEALAKGGQGSEQAAALLGLLGLEASHREMEQSDWGPRGNPGESGTHTGRRMCEIWLFLELRGLEWFEITISESKAFSILFENIFFKELNLLEKDPNNEKFMD